MRIPGAERALISEEKIVRYLLNIDHPDGASKARVLAHAGFDATCPEELEWALRKQHLSADAREGAPSAFGAKYEITRSLSGPKGSIMATSVWMIRHGESFPRLITLIPEPKE
ncbi:MAG: DUF6883 domain-containing protein [Planctomycetota bacterium]